MIKEVKNTKKWEFGDFQTPSVLAYDAIDYLKRAYPDFNPQTIIEPTCGLGAFLIASADTFIDASAVIGVEIEEDYILALNKKIVLRRDVKRFDIKHQDLFTTDWADYISQKNHPILIVGNPPWVTSSDIGRLKGSNLPEKSNFHKYSGYEAITGKSNFDISEWMLLKQLEWLPNTGDMIAMLCKTSVARKILQSVWKEEKFNIESRIIKINALKHFGAAVDACFLIVRKTNNSITKNCLIFSDFKDKEPNSSLGFHQGIMVSNAPSFNCQKNLLGRDPNYVWRSGIKHDCSKIMELKKNGGVLNNGLGESIEIEDDYLYPLLKSSDIGNARLLKTRYFALVTQRIIGQPTEAISKRAPRTWSYLKRHGKRLDNRKSIVYRDKPRFSIFGVGNYTFTPWKIAISGFYKTLKFQIISPIENNPVVFDDTVYFLNTYSEAETEFLSNILNSEPAQEFLESMVFWDDKRPITIELLKRLHLGNLATLLKRETEYEHFTQQRQVHQLGESSRQLEITF